MNIKPFTTDCRINLFLLRSPGLVPKSPHEGQTPTHRHRMAVRCNLLRPNNGSVDSSGMRKLRRNGSIRRLRTCTVDSTNAGDVTADAREPLSLLAVSLRALPDSTAPAAHARRDSAIVPISTAKRQPHELNSDELRPADHSQAAMHATARHSAESNVTALGTFPVARIR